MVAKLPLAPVPNWFTIEFDPVPKRKRHQKMKPEIHPEYVETTVNCGCGESFKTRSTVTTGSIYVEVCDKCHPFYTGKQRILDTGGRVAKFEERFGKKNK